MTALVEKNRRFLADLFAGEFRGHGIIMDPMPVEPALLGDLLYPERAFADWVDYGLRRYERRLAWHQALGDDSVPDVDMPTGTEVFAVAFGSAVHLPEGYFPCAVPRLRSAEEADRLPEPSLDAPPFTRIFEYAEAMAEQVGPEAPIRVPDIQSPFDIAALVWKKEQLFVAMIEQPEAVQRLVEKCGRLLAAFLTELQRRLPNCNLAHCPYAWAPPELGCWLSEDEAGSMSAAMFAEFCLPSLVDLSATFGGLFVHCCATADHQYANFKKIPNLRGLNRVFQSPGPRPAIETFSGQTVLMVAWTDEQGVYDLLDMALPDTRFLFVMPPQPLEEAKATHERLHARCPRA